MGRTLATPRKPARRGKGIAQARDELPPPGTTGRQRTLTAGTDLQRERILKVAAQLFARQGYAKTTMAQIVRELGMTKPFVYYYFRDKQEMFEVLSWAPAVDCFTALDFADGDPRRASVKVMEGLERLIRATIAHYPQAFFPYREPQVYRPEYLDAQRKLANHFYEKLCLLLEEARRDGDFDFADTKITALSACSLPGFLFTWYRPDGRLPPEQVVAEQTRLAGRVLGLKEETGHPSIPSAVTTS